eukprot:921416-Pleurochrysis_carterae.AAC.2
MAPDGERWRAAQGGKRWRAVPGSKLRLRASALLVHAELGVPFQMQGSTLLDILTRSAQRFFLCGALGAVHCSLCNANLLGAAFSAQRSAYPFLMQLSALLVDLNAAPGAA